MEIWLVVALLLATICYTLHLWGTSYWKRRGVFQIDASFIFGNIKDILFMKRTMQSCLWEVYQKHKEHKLVGIYSFYRPMLLVTDPHTIKQITIQGSKSFAAAPIGADERVDPVLFRHPKSQNDMKRWKESRNVLQLMFSTAKLKTVPELTTKIGHDMMKYIMERADNPLKHIEVTQRFLIDTVWNYIFGLESNAFTDPDSCYTKASLKMLHPQSDFAANAMFLYPSLSKLLSCKITSDVVENFMLSVMKTMLEHKEDNQNIKSLFFDTIFKENKKPIEEEGLSVEDVSSLGTTVYLDAYFFTANAFHFLLSDLSKQQDVQDKLRKEIFSKGKTMEDFDYDKIISLPFLHLAVCESLRLHTPTPVSARVCSKPIEVEGIKIEKGIKILIPYFALHWDDQYFHDPRKYEPERHLFNDPFKNDTLMPFGSGPKLCPGSKFAQLVLKIGVLYILLNFKLLPNNTNEEKQGQYKLPYECPDQNDKLIFQPLAKNLLQD